MLHGHIVSNHAFLFALVRLLAVATWLNMQDFGSITDLAGIGDISEWATEDGPNEEEFKFLQGY